LLLVTEAGLMAPRLLRHSDVAVVKVHCLASSEQRRWANKSIAGYCRDNAGASRDT
jgi:hypothetical protein